MLISITCASHQPLETDNYLLFQRSDYGIITRVCLADGPSLVGMNVRVLLDPLEEQFHLPTTLVQLGNAQRRKFEVVGEKDKTFVRCQIDVADAPK